MRGVSNILKEILTDHAISYEHTPDGGRIPIIDPYDGCTLGCPYCFQLDNVLWNKSLYVKINIAERVRFDLKEWPKDKTLYIGSKCDPYMKIEEQYQLTRKCLVELSQLNIPCMVTTKADYDVIFRDLDVIKGFRDNFTLLLGLTNLHQFDSILDYSELKNVQVANQLHRLGIKIWTFITPILPGITDVNSMIDALDNDIPVYLDRVRLEKDSTPANNMLSFISKTSPSLKPIYEDIIYLSKDPYYESLREKWKGNPRVKFVFE